MAVRQLYLIVMVVWVHLGDLATAWFYDGGARPEAALLRPLRDTSVILVAGLCIATVRMARSLVLPLAAYCGLAVLSMIQTLADGRAIGLAVGSFGTLMIPVLFFLVGYYCLRGYREIGAAVGLYAVLACASAAFGMWEIRHSEFWIDTLQFGIFTERVKGVLLGAQPLTGLPWSFYRDAELTRRAAGLLAAPLAQGMFLVIAMLLTLSAPRGMLRRMRLVVAALLTLGIWMAGTRGAMLAGAVALMGYLATARAMIADPRLRFGLVLAVGAGAALATRDLVIMTWTLSDGSSPGHWRSLMLNLEGLFRIPPLGYGPGAQGALAVQTQQSVVGGGEGAVFTMAYQIGLPAAATFLCFYAVCLARLWRAHRDYCADFALASFWLMLGMVVTLVTSEHILAVSGSAALWMMVGGQMRALSRSAAREPVRPHGAEALA
jgi:D-xylose transport system permease protein